MFERFRSADNKATTHHLDGSHARARSYDRIYLEIKQVQMMNHFTSESTNMLCMR
jgi:hypothetical protein